MRTTDLRYFLAKSFNAASTANVCASGGDTDIRAALASDKPLAALQSCAVRRAGITSKDVIPVAQALHATSTGAGANTSAQSQSSALGAHAWMQLSTFAHLEDRICTAYTLGSEAEAEDWLREWCTHCARSGEETRVLWAVGRLLSQQSQSQPSTVDGVVRAAWSWMDLHPEPLRLIRQAVLPGIARAGTGVSGDLLSRVSEAMELSEKVRKLTQ